VIWTAYRETAGDRRYPAAVPEPFAERVLQG
jgi:hypothetical protein